MSSSEGLMSKQGLDFEIEVQGLMSQLGFGV